MKKSLEKLLVELEAWMHRFDPSWFLIICVGGQALETTLAKVQQEQSPQPNKQGGPLASMQALRYAIQPTTAFAQAAHARDGTALEFDIHRLAGIEPTTLLFSTAKLYVESKSTQAFIVEDIDPSIRLPTQCKLDVQNLARKLQHVDPGTFGMLRCEGYHIEADPIYGGGLATVELIYRAPATATQQPITLRQLFLGAQPLSLSAIMRLAKQLVRSVCYVHTFDFVHKNIRPENVIVFQQDEDALELGDSYLIGFTEFRNVNFQTNLMGDKAWHRSLYRHPSRQGLHVLQQYVMQHDIYSLGVCLLEIGLWQSFVSYQNHDGEMVPVAGAALGLNLSDEDFAMAHLGTTVGIKDHMISLAKECLPPRLGDMYTHIVLACLTCLDDGNKAFGSQKDMQDEHGIVVGVRFVETILASVNEISV
jgi:hypothetical protein